MAKESALEKKLLPGMLVMVCLPALIRSASTPSLVERARCRAGRFPTAV
jgi:hypothetical protein